MVEMKCVSILVAVALIVSLSSCATSSIVSRRVTFGSRSSSSSSLPSSTSIISPLWTLLSYSLWASQLEGGNRKVAEYHPQLLFRLISRNCWYLRISMHDSWLIVGCFCHFFSVPAIMHNFRTEAMHYAICNMNGFSLRTKVVPLGKLCAMRFMHYHLMHYEIVDCNSI